MMGYVNYNFASEEETKAYLWKLLMPYFKIKTEVRVQHMIATGNDRLSIDAVAVPRENTGFPFEWFGIEVKKPPCIHGKYNRTLKQAIDYTHSKIIDPKATLARLNGQRIERVYVFPGDSDDITPSIADNWVPIGFPAAYWVNRLAGLFHVGMIYEREFNYPRRYRDVCFKMSAETLWSSHHGPRATPIHTRQLVGSGVPRRNKSGPPNGHDKSVPPDGQPV